MCPEPSQIDHLFKRKCLSELPTSQPFPGNFSVNISSFQIRLGLCKNDTNQLAHKLFAYIYCLLIANGVMLIFVSKNSFLFELWISFHSKKMMIILYSFIDHLFFSFVNLIQTLSPIITKKFSFYYLFCIILTFDFLYDELHIYWSQALQYYFHVSTFLLFLLIYFISLKLVEKFSRTDSFKEIIVNSQVL